MASKSYTKDSIKHLEYPYSVQEKMSMYIGDVGLGAKMHLINEVSDNSIDEFQSGYATWVKITVNQDEHWVEIEDNGRGIPFGKHSSGEDSLHMCMMKLHAGGKMDKSSYAMSAGVHGVGLACVTALSELITVTSRREGKECIESFSKGFPVKGTRKETVKKSASGTTIRFKPAPEFLGTDRFDTQQLYNKFKILSYLLPGLKIHFTIVDGGSQNSITFYHKNGLLDYIKALTKDAKIINNPEPIVLNGTFPVEINKQETATGRYSVILQWTSKPGESMWSYVNSLHTTAGGTHEKVVRKSLSMEVKSCLEPLFKKTINVLPEDVKEGLTVIVSILHPNPSFREQAKKTFMNPDVAYIESQLREQISSVFNRNTGLAKAIADKISLSARLRVAQQKATDDITSKQTAHSVLSMNDPSKLFDALSKDRSKCELFIIEGKSAMGSAKKGRWSKDYQGTFALRGKPRNAYQVDRGSEIIKNAEFSDLVRVLGAGVGHTFNIDKLRYRNVFIMADADDDGKHIQVLMLGFFFKFMRPLIEQGRLFCVNPPLYKYKEGRKVQFANNQAEWDAIVWNRMLSLNWNDLGVKVGPNRFNLNMMIPINKEWAAFIYMYWGQYIPYLKRLLVEWSCSWDVFLELAVTPTLEEFHKRCVERYGLFTGDVETYGMWDSTFHRIPNDLQTFKRLKSHPMIVYLKNLTCGYRYIPSHHGSNPIQAWEFIHANATPKSRQRLKGLGETNSEDLGATSMHPETRNVTQITMHDEDKAVRYFDACLGKDSELRKAMILENQGAHINNI